MRNSAILCSSASGDSGPLACDYSGRLGRARVRSKGVVTFASCRDLNSEALAEMIIAIEAGIAVRQLTVA